MRANTMLLAVVLATAAARAHAEPWPHWGKLEESITSRMQAQVSARLARFPHPIRIGWSPRRMADFDFGAEVIAGALADLDGDGRDELLVLTTTEVVAISGLGANKVEVVARVALPGPENVPRPRDPLGEVDVVSTETGTELWVRSSTMARGVRFAATLPLQVIGTFDGMPACAPRVSALVPGRGLLVGKGTELPPLYHAARCTRTFYDEHGEPATGMAVVDTAETLTLTLAPCASWAGCDERQPAQAVSGVGFAFASADLDRDGRAEVVAAAAKPPGTGERLTIFESRADSLHVEDRFDFELGAVAVVIGQLDADEELEVVSLHRRFRTRPVEVWVWN